MKKKDELWEKVKRDFEEMKAEDNKVKSLVLSGFVVDLRWFEKVKNNEMVRIADILSRM